MHAAHHRSAQSATARVPTSYSRARQPLAVGLPKPFGIELRCADDAAHVAAFGELNTATVGLLDDRLHELLEIGFRRLVLDLRHLTLIDPKALRFILARRDKERAVGVDFILIEAHASPPLHLVPPGPVRRVERSLSV